MPKNDELKKQLEVIQNQLIEMREEIRGGREDILKTHIATNQAKLATTKTEIAIINLQMTTLKNLLTDIRMSDFNLYWSIFVSAMIGVLGNWFVTLWFEPATPDILSSLFISGFFLVIATVFLAIQMIRILRKITKDKDIQPTTNT